MLRWIAMLFRRKPREACLASEDPRSLLRERIAASGARIVAAKRRLSQLHDRIDVERNTLAYIELRLRDHEDRARAALIGGRRQEADQAARLAAERETERAARRTLVACMESQTERLLAAIDKSQKALAELRDALVALEARAAQGAGLEQLDGDLGGRAMIGTGWGQRDVSLDRLLAERDPLESEPLDADLGETALRAFRAAPHVTAEDVLARLGAALQPPSPPPPQEAASARDDHDVH